jgi:phage gp36-like protein
MAYATVDEFETRFGVTETIELTNLEDPLAESPDLDVLEQALELASEEIDGYLWAASYALPLASPPLILREWCLDIARYKLDRNANREDVRRRYDDAIAWFKGLAKGLTMLPGAAQIIPTEATTTNSPKWATSRDPIFTQDSLWDY